MIQILLTVPYGPGTIAFIPLISVLLEYLYCIYLYGTRVVVLVPVPYCENSTHGATYGTVLYSIYAFFLIVSFIKRRSNIPYRTVRYRTYWILEIKI